MRAKQCSISLWMTPRNRTSAIANHELLHGASRRQRFVSSSVARHLSAAGTCAPIVAPATGFEIVLDARTVVRVMNNFNELVLFELERLKRQLFGKKAESVDP